MTLDAYLAADCTRCPGCGYHESTQGCACNGTLRFTPGVQEKAEGQARATAAHPDERQRVDAAIRQLAATGRPFSANDARALHGVKGGVVGAAFTAANKAGLIRPIGDETSTSAKTHGHRVYSWVGVAA